MGAAGTHDPVFVWTTIGVVAVIVAAGRWVFLFLPREWRPRGLLEQALSHAPLAALAALVAPQVLAPMLDPTPGASPLAGLGDPRVLSALAAIAVVHWRRNVFAGVVAGVVAYLSLASLA
jgi:branched-subunit amino acid transport protein